MCVYMVVIHVCSRVIVIRSFTDDDSSIIQNSKCVYNKSINFFDQHRSYILPSTMYWDGSDQ